MGSSRAGALSLAIAGSAAAAGAAEGVAPELEIAAGTAAMVAATGVTTASALAGWICNGEGCTGAVEDVGGVLKEAFVPLLPLRADIQ